MTVSDQLENYSALLRIRQKGRRRDVKIIGGLFLVSFVYMIGTGLVTGLHGREVYVVVPTIVCLGLGYLSEWMRLEIIKGSLELIDNLQRAIGETLDSD